MSSGKVLLGLLAGVAAGAALGILFAPDKGTETRRTISRKGSEYADELGEKFNNFIDSLTEKGEAVKKEASNMLDKGKQRMDDVMDSAGSKM